MLIGGIDVGTTGCKLTVYNSDGDFVNNEYVEYDVSRQNGEHEIDASVIWTAVCTVIGKTCKKYPMLGAVGITTFGETFVLLDDNDNVLVPSMLYTDPRGEKETRVLNERLGEDKIIFIAGVKPHSMYSLPKLMWIKNNLPHVYDKAKRVVLMEDYIVYMLSGKAQIDYSLAARTLGFDIRNKCWSTEIFDAAGIDISLMSEPVPTGTAAGSIRPSLADELGISRDIIIVNGCHDQVAAAVGSGVFEVGDAVDGTGTVECVTPVFDSIPQNKKLYDEGYSVVPYVFDGTYVCYALSFTGGATLKWFRDNFARYEAEIAKERGTNVYAELDSVVSSEPTDLLILPHFAGAANPYMDNGSRAVMVGLTLEHTAADIYKALMEGVTYEIMLNIEHLEGAGIKLNRLVATGGGASSDVWLSIKADILDRPVTALSAKEAGACGTCMLAAVAVGACMNLNEAKERFVRTKKQFEPCIKRAKIYKKNYNAYKKMYNAVRPIVEEMQNG